MVQWRQLAHVMQNVWLNKTSPTVKFGLGEVPSRGQQLAVLCGESPNPPGVTFPWQSTFATQRSGPTGPYWAWITSPCASWPGRPRRLHRTVEQADGCSGDGRLDNL